MKFIQKVGSKKGEKEKIEVHLVRGKGDSGIHIYAYVAVYASQVRDLNLSLITRTTDLEKYGVILTSGEGEPTDKMKQYIQDTFLVDA